MNDETWRERLSAAVGKDGRSLRDISLSAGLSHGYLHGVLRDGKQPTLDRFANICRTMNISMIYALLGTDISAETEEIIRALEDNPDKRAAILSLLGH